MWRFLLFIDSYGHKVMWPDQQRLVTMWIVAVLTLLRSGTLGCGLSEGLNCILEGPYFDIYHIIVCPHVKVCTFELSEMED